MRVITSMFGVHTLDEFNHSVTSIHEAANEGEQVITLLGAIPSHLTFNLSFIQDVILYENDMIPSSDVEQLRTVFHIGDTCKVRLYRLIVPLSFELEFIMPKSNILQEFKHFLAGKSNLLAHILQ